MRCEACGQKAIFDNRCRDHFLEHFENTVSDTIARFSLISKGQRIAVAVSGGKDSLSVLYILKKLYFDVEALAVDEGIAGYRDRTLEDLKRFCRKNGIPLKVRSVREKYSHTLDFYAQKARPCSVCGVFRRQLLNEMAEGYDVIATGHNLDDECQSIMMNYLKGNLELSARLGPKSGIAGQDGFTQRVKPLYFLSEREIRAYCFLMGFDIHYTECPHASVSFRYKLGESLNDLENKMPGTKRKIVSNFLDLLPRLKRHYSTSDEIEHCNRCGQPSSHDLCRACVLKEKLA